jgi:hypothetical protein
LSPVEIAVFALLVLVVVVVVPEMIIRWRKQAGGAPSTPESEVAKSIRGLTSVLVLLAVVAGGVAFVGWVPIQNCNGCSGIGGLLGAKCPDCGGVGKQTVWQIVTSGKAARLP